MLKDSHGRRLWIRDEYGQHLPVMGQADIANRPRGRGEPDWWVVAKDPAWTPPEPRSLLSLGATDADGAGGATGSGTGGHTKIGAGHKPQGYGGHGRYTGPRGGSISMDGGPVRLYEGEAAGEPGGEPDAAEPEAEDEAGQEAAEEVSRQLEGILVADSGQIASDAGGGLSGGNEVRGPVTPPSGKVIPPAPPAPEEPHLVYSQSTGEMKGPDGKPLVTGYAGRGGGQNNPDAEGIKGVGPLPQGNWRMKELDEQTCKEKGWPPPAYRLTPDEETRARVETLGRDPDSFYVHATARHPEDRGRESQGCIALDIPGRRVLAPYSGRWIRVER